MSFALLWLEGPFQSWGCDSRFDRRTTLDFPTRSGILGLVLAALGRPGPQAGWLAKMRRHSQTIAAYARSEARELRDFQMFGAGYGEDDPWLGLFVPKRVDGGKTTSGSRIVWKDYLQDRAFACALELPDSEAGEIAEALKYPAWPLCLGRRSCVPTDIVYRGVYAGETTALNRAGKIAAKKGLRKLFMVRGGKIAGAERFAINDVPAAFGRLKAYESRFVSKKHG